MRKLLFLFIIGLAISLTSCRKDFVFEPNTGGLEFSKDTVYLDTVFTNIGSSTYRLKVYNKSDKDISIPKIQLRKGITSKYRITVDGMTGDVGATNKIFSNVELLAKDSLFIFIEVTADAANTNPNDFLYTDKIDFYNISGTPQEVDLVTLIQDAIFIYPNKTLPNNIKETLVLSGNPTTIEGHELLDSELNWTNVKPYVIYGYALVANGKTLTVEQGSNVYFHANSGLIVDKLATLNINGQLSDYNADGTISIDREIRFEGDRLEPSFENVPGQWGTILIMSQNTSNISHLTIKNATIGLYVIPLDIDNFYSTKLNINNSQIYNCSNFGILSIGAVINGNNLVVNLSGQANLACTYGGNYNFKHCTFNNNWPSSKQVSVLLNDYFENETTLYVNNPINIYNFTNCIVYGSNQNQLFIDKKSTNSFNYDFANCLIKVNNSINNPFYPPTNTTNYNSGCKISTNSSVFNPKFENLNQNKLNLLVSSAAIDFGLILPDVPKDIIGKNRVGNSDIGAYEFQP